MKTSLNTSSVTSRDPKGLEATRKFCSVYDKSGLDDKRAQTLNENDEFATGLSNLIARCSQSKFYEDEEVLSNYGYCSGYRNPVAVTDQIDILRKHWPTLNPDKAIAYARDVYPKLPFPAWIEGPFVLIRPGFFSDKYGEELEEVLKAIKKDRNGNFANYRKNQLGPDRLRQTTPTLGRMAEIVKQQPESDLLVVPAQFGVRHRGRSVRRARSVFTTLEFGIGAKDGGTMILTNPSRLQDHNDLCLDMSGDAYNDPGSEICFDRDPCFGFDGGCVEFGAHWCGVAHRRCGSVSGCVPQQ